MSERKERKFSPEEKVMILKKHLLENTPISDICDQYGLHPTVFYRWQKQFKEKYLDYITSHQEVLANVE